MWACGILMYLMFSGTHPFKATNNYDFFKNVLDSSVNFTGPEWRCVSKSVKNLIRAMLTKNPTQRCKVSDILNSKWMKRYSKMTTPPKNISYDAIKNLMLFNSERKLEQALQSYINNKISMNRAAGKLLNIFEEMDQQGDGELPIDLVISRFKEHMQIESVLEDDLRKVIIKMDENGDGLIQYSEFID